jgi:tight adherence protein C
MSRAELLAAAAGVIAAAGVVDLARAWATRTATRRATPPRPPRHPLLDVLRLFGRPLRHRVRPTSSHHLAAAGTRLPPEELAAIRAGAAAIALLAAAPFATSAPGRLGVLALAAAPAAGLYAPLGYLKRRARQRAARMDAELADVADLLRVAAAAGLPPGRALAEVGRRHPGELARELAATANREALGVPREAALDELRARAPTPGVHTLAAALERAARHGAPLDEALQALADDARARHARVAAERGARAAPKVQLIVALVLVPSVLLLVAAALVPALTGAA